jgi:hypothetical protein
VLSNALACADARDLGGTDGCVSEVQEKV